MSDVVTMPELQPPPALGLYVHLPWCVRKCPYCDFNSHGLSGDLPEDAYVAALLADLEHELPAVWGRRIETLFIGGGTPSLFSPDAIHGLLSGIRARMRVAPGAEITLEANPGTVEHQRFAGFREAGINRLSLGVQSFDDGLLQALGRIHSGAEARRAAEAARQAGIDNLNLDLMYGLPGQSVAQALADVDHALALAPAHLSHYELTLEPGTTFHRKPPRLPDQERTMAMEQHCRDRLAEAGYERYEVSAFAKPGRRCRHNLNYWRFGDYLGIGAGAHGKITQPHTGTVRRRQKHAAPNRYMAMASEGAVADEQILDTNDLVAEFMLNALRLREGFSTREFQAHTGLELDTLDGALAQARRQGWLVPTRDGWRPSDTGYRFLNDLTALFLAA